MEIRQERETEGPPREDRDLPPPAQLEEVEATLQPPTLRDLGRSIANLVLRAVLLGTVGGVVGALRGRPAPSGDEKPREGATQGMSSQRGGQVVGRCSSTPCSASLQRSYTRL